MSLNSVNLSSASTINVTASTSNEHALSKFPITRERLDFGDWLFKAETFFAAKDLIDSGDIKLVWVPTADQLADVFTKSLSTSTFTSIRDRLVHSSNNNINNDHHDEQ